MLRQITIGQGPEEKGSRVTGFDVAVASEIMAILARATSLRDMRGPQGRIVIDTNRSGEPVTADDRGRERRAHGPGQWGQQTHLAIELVRPAESPPGSDTPDPPGAAEDPTLS